MKYLWDTDSCIYFLNGNEKIAKKVRELGIENIFTTVINIFELKFGAYNSTKVESNLKRVRVFKSKLTILDNFNDDIGTLFAKKKALLKKKGITISDFDLLIASFAISNDMHLVTNNIKHFKHIPDLIIDNWMDD